MALLISAICVRGTQVLDLTRFSAGFLALDN